MKTPSFIALCVFGLAVCQVASWMTINSRTRGIYYDGQPVSGGSSTNQSATVSSNSIAESGGMLANGSTTMSGTLDMGGHSITNVGTNSIVFVDGTHLGSINGQLRVTAEGLDPKTVVDTGNVRTYAPLYTSDGATITMIGNTFKLQPMIMDNILQMRYELWNQSQIGNGRFLDGIGYWFNSRDGVDTNLSSGITWKNPGWDNAIVVGGTNIDMAYPRFEPSLAKGMVPSSEYLDFSANGFSLSVWIKWRGSVPYAAFVSRDSWWESRAWQVTWAYEGGDKLSFSVMQDGGTSPEVPFTFPDNQWTHVAISGTYGGAINLYTNGVFAATATYPTDVSYHNIPMRIAGRHGIDGCLNDYQIDANQCELVIWQKPITQEEITKLYNDGVPLIGSIQESPWDTCSYYAHLNENGGTTIVDSGPHGINGTYDEGMIWESETLSTAIWATTNSSLVSVNQIMQFIPSYAYASAVVNVGGNSVTTNDVKIYVSRDGGTTWSYAEDDIVDTWDASNKLVVGTCDLSGQPSDSNLRVKVDLSSNHTWKVMGIAAPCGE